MKDFIQQYFFTIYTTVTLHAVSCIPRVEVTLVLTDPRTTGAPEKSDDWSHHICAEETSCPSSGMGYCCKLR